MNLGRLAKRAQQLIDKRGGTDALKQDAQELGDIVKGKGSAGTKAKAAAEALKDPGAKGKEPGAKGKEPAAMGKEPAAPKGESAQRSTETH